MEIQFVVVSLPLSQLTYPVNDINYKHLFHECPIPMYVFDSETLNIVEANTSALLQYGYTRREFIGLSILKIRPEQDIENFLALTKDIPETYFDAGRWRHVKKNGRIFYVHVFSHGAEFNGRPAILALAIDVDKQAENEQKLNEIVRQLEEQNQKLKYFSWLNSHKIRNHVANILGLVALYKEDKTDMELQTLVMNNIERSAEELDLVLKEIAVQIQGSN